MANIADKIAAKIANDIAARRTTGLTSKIAHDAMADRVASNYIYQKKQAAQKKSK